MTNQELKAVIFDMDGTLIDSESVYTEGYHRAFLEKGIAIDLAVIESWSGQNSEDTLELIDAYTKDRSLSAEIRLMRIDYFNQALKAGRVSLNEHAKELISFCKKEGLKVGLATSTAKDWALDILSCFDLANAFDFTAFGDEAKAFKPDPDIYHLALQRGELSATEVLVVEDSKSGILAALGAGLPVIHLTDVRMESPYSNPAVLKKIKSLKEVEELVLERLS